MSEAIEVGKPAPVFSIPDHEGHTLSLKSFAGAPLVIFFYPKDDTSGCTAEALAFSTMVPAFKDLGAAVIGISPDSPKSHAKFRSKHNLSVPLGSDEDKTTLEAYGVWTEKAMYGRKYMGCRTNDRAGCERRHNREDLAESESPWPRRRGSRRGQSIVAADRVVVADAT